MNCNVKTLKFSVYFTSWNEAVTLKLKCIYILSSKKIIKEIQYVLFKIKGIKKWNIHHETEKENLIIIMSKLYCSDTKTLIFVSVFDSKQSIDSSNFMLCPPTPCAGGTDLIEGSNCI